MKAVLGSRVNLLNWDGTFQKCKYTNYETAWFKFFTYLKKSLYSNCLQNFAYQILKDKFYITIYPV